MMKWQHKPTRFLIWFILLGLTVLFANVLFPARRVELTRESGMEEPVIDAWLFYSPAELKDALPRFSPAGRQLYAVTELTLDVAFPLIYGSWIFLTLDSLASVVLPPGSPWRMLRKTPFWLIGADLLENSLLAIIMLTYPPANHPLATATAAASALKWGLGLVCLVLVILGCLAFLVGAVRRRLA